jgi:hypothetical protein
MSSSLGELRVQSKNDAFKWVCSMDGRTYGQMKGATMEKITSIENANSRKDHSMDEFIH